MDPKAFTTITTEIFSTLLAVGVVLLTVNIAWTAFQAQVGTAGGSPHAMAHAFEQFVIVIVLFILMVSAQSIGSEVQQIIQQIILASVTNEGSSLVYSSREIGKLVVQILIMLSWGGMAVFASTAFLGAQVSHALGMPTAAGSIFARLGMVILSGILMWISLGIADMVVAAAR